MTGVTAVTCFGLTADPEELCAIARAIGAGEDGWRERVDALPRYVLTPETLASEPDVIAGRLRGIAGFLGRVRDGTAFVYPELAAKAAAIREQAKDKPFTFGGRRRRP
jgi:hypothetical protein